MRSGFVFAVALLMGFGSATLRADIFVRNATAGVIYQYSNGVMYEGPASRGKRIFKYDARQGRIMTIGSSTLAIWKQEVMYDKSNKPMYALDGKKICRRTRGGKTVGFIDGRKIYRGNGPGGKLILYPDAPLPDAIAVYLFHFETGKNSSGGASDNADSGEGKLRIDIKKVPFGYYLGAPKEGKIVLSLRGDTIYYGEDMKEVAYTRRGLCFYKAGNSGLPDFRMDNSGRLYRGSEANAANLVMSLDWFNCYAPGKRDTDAIGTLQYVGQNILTEGYTKPSQRPDFTGKRILLSSTLPNDKVDMALRIFLVYLTQLDPECRARLESMK